MALKTLEVIAHLNLHRGVETTQFECIDTIRAALTALDVNEELLEALDVATTELEEHSKCEDCQVGVPLNTLNKCHGAIARAEGQKAAGE